MEEDHYLKILVQRFADRTATDEELEIFVQLINEGKLDEFLIAAMNSDLNLAAEDEKQLLVPSSATRSWHTLAAAAAVILAMLTVGYLMLRQPTDQTGRLTKIPVTPVRPGSLQATLTLAKGQKIKLVKGLTGQLAWQKHTQISINSAGELVYSPSGLGTGLEYNRLSTSAAEQSPYPLVLADGTKVWLNAKSSIVFPTQFNAKVRQVSITGEAYFVVAHQSYKPFQVRAGNQIVEDIGTAFNINSYPDEPSISTTLVEGAAKVIAQGKVKILSAGQRSLVSEHTISVQKADAEAQTAWLKGSFVFHNEDIHSVMRQLSRWYNVEIVYDYQPKNVVIGGGFSKSREISDVLMAIEQTGLVKFRIAGHQVHIIK